MGIIMAKKTELKTVTSKEYTEAKYAIQRIQPLVTALEGIDRKTVGGNVNISADIHGFKDQIIPIFQRYQAIVAQGEKQYSCRDKELLNKANLRFFRIPIDINHLEAVFENKLRSHEQKSNELKKQGISQAEIDRICKPITKSEREELAAQIKTLKDEKIDLLAFINDGPCFDIQKLKNTNIYREALKTA